jgi:hypothetical protein
MSIGKSELSGHIKAGTAAKFVEDNLQEMPNLIRNAIQFKRVCEQLSVDQKNQLIEQYTSDQLRNLYDNPMEAMTIIDALPVKSQNIFIESMNMAILKDNGDFILINDVLKDVNTKLNFFNLHNKKANATTDLNLMDVVQRTKTDVMLTQIYNDFEENECSEILEGIIENNPQQFYMLKFNLSDLQMKLSKPSVYKSTMAMFRPQANVQAEKLIKALSWLDSILKGKEFKIDDYNKHFPALKESPIAEHINTHPIITSIIEENLEEIAAEMQDKQDRDTASIGSGEISDNEDDEELSRIEDNKYRHK